MKIPPFLGLLSSPCFAHDASCVMLNIDWTPLVACKLQLSVHAWFTKLKTLSVNQTGSLFGCYWAVLAVKADQCKTRYTSVFFVNSRWKVD